MKIEINYESSVTALNTLLQPYRGKELTRQQLMETVGKCIPIKSQVPNIIAEMVKDHTLVKKPVAGRKVMYTLKPHPIFIDQVRNWVKTVRTMHTNNIKKSSIISEESVVKYLSNLSTKEFTEVLKPICSEKLCKLYAPAGYNEDAINRLPKEILSQIVKMEEV